MFNPKVNGSDIQFDFGTVLKKHKRRKKKKKVPKCEKNLYSHDYFQMY